MSAGMTAATEIAERNRYANTTFGDLSNAFLELAEESRRWENVFDAQTSELRGLRQQVERERKARETAMHASAPSGCVCSDCGIDQEPCPVCYRVWWTKKHPNTNIVMADDSAVFAAEQRAAELQARLDRVEAILQGYADSYRRMDGCVPTGDVWIDFTQNIIPAIRALAAAGGQESAATQANAERAHVNQAISGSATENALAADPALALPGLEILASHSGKSQNREWHSVGTWLYPGEAIYEGTPK